MTNETGSSSESAPRSFGVAKRTGAVEGGNIDPLVVSGELSIRKHFLIRDSDTVKFIRYKKNRNEAIIVCDESSAFNYSQRTTETSQYDRGYICNQTRAYYYNGRSIIDVDDIIANLGEEDNDYYLYRHYKMNNGAWLPGPPTNPINDRPGMQMLYPGDTTQNICLIVGERKNMLDTDGDVYDRAYGAVMVFIPSYLGAERNISISPAGASPLRNVAVADGNVPGSETIDFGNIEFFGVCWAQNAFPVSNLGYEYDYGQVTAGLPTLRNNIAYNVAFIVGTEREGSAYSPKAYMLYFNSSNPTGAIAFDLNIEDAISGGVLFSCDFDDVRNKLYVVGSSMDDETKDIFAEYDVRTQQWTDYSTNVKVKHNIYDSSSGYLIQDDDAIRFIYNDGQFLTNGVKRGQPIWIDITDYNALADTENRTFPANAWQSGLFFVNRVVSDTELILDKRMPNVRIMHRDENSNQNYYFCSPLFKWGYLNTTLNTTVANIIIDVPQIMVGDNGPTGVSFPASGGTVFLEGEQIIYNASTYVDVGGGGNPNYRRYTLTGCQRGANGTVATAHRVTKTLVTPANPTLRARNVVLLCEERDFKTFSRITDCKNSFLNSALYISGDNNLIMRWDKDIKKFVKFADAFRLNKINFGQIGWRPDKDSFSVTANLVSSSFIYQYENGYFQRSSVPTSGIISDVKWSPDGLTNSVGGRGLYLLTKKLNTQLSEREPKANPAQFLFNNYEFADDRTDTAFAFIRSEILPIDDFDSDTLSLFIDFYDGNDVASENVIEMEFRIYLSGTITTPLNYRYPATIPDAVLAYQGRQLMLWKTVTITDTPSDYNSSFYTAENQTNNVGHFARRIFKLPVWAKYIAVDAFRYDKFWSRSIYVTVGVAGGQK